MIVLTPVAGVDTASSAVHPWLLHGTERPTEGISCVRIGNFFDGVELPY